MNILLISASHNEKNNHAFSYHFKETCKRMGIHVWSLSPYDGSVVRLLREDEYFKDFYIGLERFPLSRFVNFEDIDLIFIENPKWPFENDTGLENDLKIPVVYYHRDMHSNVFVRNPDFLAIRFWTEGFTPDGRPNGGQPEILERDHPEIWYNKEIKKIWFTMAISEAEFGELNQFKGINRIRKGWAYYGSYKSVREMMTFNTVHYQIYRHHLEIIDFVKKKNLATEFREINVSLDAYKKHLFQFEATLIIPAWDSWETRRLYEASYCKCVPLLFIQNENARKVFEMQGYKDGETCITFTKKEDLLHLDLRNYNLNLIRAKGHEMVKQRHTYRARILELLDKININKILEKRGKTEEIKNKIYI